jgi:hypothetical protein
MRCPASQKSEANRCQWGTEIKLLDVFVFIYVCVHTLPLLLPITVAAAAGCAVEHDHDMLDTTLAADPLPVLIISQLAAHWWGAPSKGLHTGGRGGLLWYSNCRLVTVGWRATHTYNNCESSCNSGPWPVLPLLPHCSASCRSVSQLPFAALS